MLDNAILIIYFNRHVGISATVVCDCGKPIALVESINPG
jgi:hypothetical protein